MTFRTSYFFVLFGLCAFILLLLPLSLHVLALSLSLLVLPSRSLSKNALSFFIRDVISCAYSSSSSAPASAPGPSSSSSASSSSRAHSVRGIATLWAFARNASLSSVLAASVLVFFFSIHFLLSF